MLRLLEVESSSDPGLPWENVLTWALPSIIQLGKHIQQLFHDQCVDEIWQLLPKTLEGVSNYASLPQRGPTPLRPNSSPLSATAASATRDPVSERIHIYSYPSLPDRSDSDDGEPTPHPMTLEPASPQTAVLPEIPLFPPSLNGDDAWT